MSTHKEIAYTLERIKYYDEVYTQGQWAEKLESWLKGPDECSHCDDYKERADEAITALQTLKDAISELIA